MKNEKYLPMTNRQIRKLREYGIEPVSDWTMHKATQVLNRAIFDAERAAELGIGPENLKDDIVYPDER